VGLVKALDPPYGFPHWKNALALNGVRRVNGSLRIKLSNGLFGPGQLLGPYPRPDTFLTEPALLTETNQDCDHVRLRSDGERQLVQLDE
jgi:hypothetical protein